MADAPGGTDDGGTAGFLFASDDSADGDDVVSVGGVTHSENESDRKNGEQGDQRILKARYGIPVPARAVLVYCCTMSQVESGNSRPNVWMCGGLVRMSPAAWLRVTAGTFADRRDALSPLWGLIVTGPKNHGLAPLATICRRSAAFQVRNNFGWAKRLR